MSFPAQLERALKARGHAVEVINAGVSGDTTASGLERLRWAVPERIDAVILELGANDALRGLEPGAAKANLDKMITTLKAGGAEVLLAGMLAPRNLGEEYTRAFDAIYPELAKKHGLLLYPFFLDGVALDGKLNLGDGIHPNPQGRGRDHEADPAVGRAADRPGPHPAGRGTKGLDACRACSLRIEIPRGDPPAPVADPRAALRRQMDRAGEHAHHLRFAGDIDGRTADDFAERWPAMRRPFTLTCRAPAPSAAASRACCGRALTRARARRALPAHERAARARAWSPIRATSIRT